MKSKLICILLLMLLSMSAMACSKVDKENLGYETMDSEAFFEAVDIPEKLSIDVDLDAIKAVKKVNNYKAKHIEFDKQTLIDTLIVSEVVEEVIWGGRTTSISEGKRNGRNIEFK